MPETNLTDEITLSIQKRLKVATYMAPGQDMSLVAQDICTTAVMPILTAQAIKLGAAPDQEAAAKADAAVKLMNEQKEAYGDLEKTVEEVLKLDRRTAEWRTAFEQMRAVFKQLTDIDVPNTDIDPEDPQPEGSKAGRFKTREEYERNAQ